MSKLYLLDLGYLEDTVVYELVPKEIKRWEQKSLDEILADLKTHNMKHVVVDSAHPREIEKMWNSNPRQKLFSDNREPNILPITGRLPKLKEKL